MKGMKGLIVLAIAATLGGCGAKKDKKDDGSGSATPVTKPVGDTAITCPPGSAVKDGACVVVVTPEKVAVVAQQQTRIDDLAKLLDKAEVVGAPIELLDGFRQLDAWKQVLLVYPKLKVVDDAIATLRDGVKQLHVLRDSLGAASVGLGDLKGSLDKVLHDPGVARQLDDLQKQVSGQVRQAVEPLERQVIDTVQKVIVPVAAQLSDISDLVISACTMAKLSGGSDKMKELCGVAKDTFNKATAFLDDLKTRPAALFDELTKQLLGALNNLLDSGSKQLLDAAQTKVNEALKLPGAGSGSGSGS